MRWDAEAMAHMAENYPNAFRLFGDHQSAEMFAEVVLAPGWLVVEEGECWVMLERLEPTVWDLHWFCPNGADVSIIRRILRGVFASGAGAIIGRPINQPSRVLARAVGFERGPEGVYSLTPERFLRYNLGKPGCEATA